MKLITAYIQPFMSEKVTDALRAGGVRGVTTMPCQGFGRRIDGSVPQYEDVGVELGYAPKVRLETVCHDEEVEGVIRVIRESAHTGRHGDGKIIVTEVIRVIDVRTGTEGATIL